MRPRGRLRAGGFRHYDAFRFHSIRPSAEAASRGVVEKSEVFVREDLSDPSPWMTGPSR